MNGQGHRRRAVLGAVALLLAFTGTVLLVVGFRAQRHAPQPPASIAGSYALPPATPTATPRRTSAAPSTPGPSQTPSKPTARPTGHGPVLPRAVPTELSIPAIGVHSDMLQLGLNPDGTVQVPPLLLQQPSRAGWYRYSPTPGQLGPSVILGHIDSAANGPAVFFRLGALRPGDTISVTRADNTVAVFRVDAVAEYPKDHFPTLTVYGNTDHAALRLITCGGAFNFTERSYESNIVAFASLVSVHPA